jgi:hypothetical protein
MRKLFIWVNALIALALFLISFGLTGGNLFVSIGLAILGIVASMIIELTLSVMTDKDDEMHMKAKFRKLCRVLSHEKKKNYSEYIRLGICLMESVGEKEITFQKDIEAYIQVLTASLWFAKNEWFATYTIPINAWDDFGRFANEYLDALRKARIRKTRMVIRPRSEIDLKAILRTTLVKDTLGVGGAAGIIYKEKITSEIEDFAIYDDNLVVIGRILGNSCKLKTPAKITICRGKRADEYKAMKKDCRRIRKAKWILPV